MGQSPIGAFWSWWRADGHRLDPSRVSTATDELNRLVTSIHPDLTWHFGPGSGSQHRLTVSAGGIAEVRPAAERWLRAAPAPNDTWEFRSSQERDPNALGTVLGFGDSQLDLSRTTFDIETDEQAMRVHLRVHHPEFATMPEPARMQVSYMLLDWLLGEDDVERWVGEIKAWPEALDPARRADEVVAAVDQLVAARDDDQWKLAEFEDRDGFPGTAVFQRGVRWIDFPTLDRHQVISAVYPARENGFPADGAVFDSLRSLEDELASIIGARGRLVASETHRGVRTFHYYTDGEDQNVDAAIAEWAARTSVVDVQAEPDPAWSQVRRFTG